MTAGANPNPDQTTKPKPSGRVLPAIARVLMGLAFTAFGFMGLFHLTPQPKDLPPAVTEFMGAMMNTHYFFPLLFGTQLVVGLLLLLNIFVPLALVLIMPVLVNIILYHIFLQPPGIVPGAILMALDLYLAWAYRKAYCPLLTMRLKPNEA
jgi:uncharacterized membrane protein YphA (DoxX/SURF4 family)